MRRPGAVNAFWSRRRRDRRHLCDPRRRASTPLRTSPGPSVALGSSVRSLQGEDVDGAALRNVRIFAGKQQVQAPLHPRRIDTPAGLDGDVLLAVHRERDRHAVDAGQGRVLPQDLSGLGIEGAEQAVISRFPSFQMSP
jgi:hypothetical protein